MEMAPNDTMDLPNISNSSQYPDESMEQVEENSDFKQESIDDAPNPSDDSVDDGRPPSLTIPEESTGPAVPPTPVLIPSMKGTMTYAGGSITCKGKWAMSDASHDVSGQTSDFEFKLVKKDESCTSIFPVDGTYQGWFMLKQAPPAKGSVRIEDREIEMHFQPAEDNNFKVTGHGSNKFGLFNLSGTLSELGAVHIYREYYQLTPQPVATPTTKRQPGTGGAVGRPEGIQRRPSVGVDPNAEATPREGAGRVRKQSSAMREYQESSQKPVSVPTPRSSSGAASAVDVPSSGGALVRQSSTTAGERSQRLPAAMRKCADLLREMSKLPQARWFLEPVDPIKLGIPEYPKIIKHPMDFSTIRSKVETNEYDSIESFAEDMRLVFRNAITFNAAKDNIVNINAREVLSKFEDRYRMIIAQMEGNFAASLPPEPKLSRSSSAASFSGKGVASSGANSSNNNKKRASVSGLPVGRPSLGAGPRQPPPYVPPAAVDANISQIMELQKQLAAMKEEVERLRALLHEKEIAQSIQETKDAAQTPLTYEEKKQLVAMVGKLPPEKLEELVKIIRDGLPDEKKNDDISEVPLEILDTLTLRRLQKFVKESVPAKKRPASTIPRAKSEPSLKKSKKASGSGADGLGNVPGTAEHNDIDLFDHNELLMENDKFVAPEETSMVTPGVENHNNSINSNSNNVTTHLDNGSMMMDVVHHESSIVMNSGDNGAVMVATTTATIVEGPASSGVHPGTASLTSSFMMQDDEEEGNEWSALA